jgi:hypothetical protein
MKRLVIKINLLPWYNELHDALYLDDPNFPKAALNKLKDFGNCTIEFINREKTIFVRI